MSKRRKKKSKNRRLSSGVLLLNNPYYVGTIPTPRIVKVLRRESRKIARKIIPDRGGRRSF